MANPTPQTDFDLFLIVLPTIQSLISNPDRPKRLFLKALHVWTRPVGDSLCLNLNERTSLLSYILKQAREDPSLDEIAIHAAVEALIDRGTEFSANRFY